MSEKKSIFTPVSEKEVTRAIVDGFAKDVLFHLTGEPFCEDRDCRLFNSHWQEEVLHSQMDGRYEFCPRHEAILKELKGRSSFSSLSYSIGEAGVGS